MEQQEQQMMQGQNVPSSTNEENILQTAMKYFFTYVRPYVWLYPAGAVLFLLAGFIYLQTVTPLYRSTTRMNISTNKLRTLDVRGLTDPTYESRGSVFLNTQTRLICSPDILEPARASLGAAGERLDYCSAPKIHVIEGTNLVDISIESANSELAAKMCNAIANSYMDFMFKRRVVISNTGVDLLRDQLAELQEKRKQAMDELLRFKQDNAIFDLQQNYSSLVNQINNLNNQIFEVGLDIEELEMSLQEIAENRKTAAIMMPYLLPAEGVSANNIAGLKNMLLTHEMGLPQLLTQYNEQHIAVKTHRVVADMIKNAGEEEVEICIKGLELRKRRALKRQAGLQKKIKEIEEKLAVLDKLGGEYRIREATCNSLDATCNMLVNRISEIRIADSTTKMDEYSIFVLEPAVASRVPFYPVRSKILMMMLLAGLACAGLISFILVSINNKITDISMVNAAFGGNLPIMGHIPCFTEDEDTLLKSSVDSNVDEAFRNVRTSLNLSMMMRQSKVIALSSAMPSEGKTFIACNLAKSFARDGKKTLLIELDLRRPRMHKILDKFLPKDRSTRGMSNVLIGDCKLADVVTPVKDLGIDVALCGPMPPNPSELLNSNYFKQMLVEAKESYDLILLDTAPILVASDTSIIEAQNIPLLLVSRLFALTRPLLMHLVETMSQLNLRPSGLISNDVDLPDNFYSGYGYGYGKYGYGKYGYGKYGYGYGKYSYGKYGYGYGKAQSGQADKKENNKKTEQPDGISKEPKNKEQK